MLAPELAFLTRHLPREEFPTILDLCCGVGRHTAPLVAKGYHVVGIDRDYNASWSIVGARRRRILRLGLPLLVALDPQERVALIAHELAHARNGDASRSFVVGGALTELHSYAARETPRATCSTTCSN